jgi:acyl-CoA thioesterase 11/acyl-coenzyme A thioesterase 9
LSTAAPSFLFFPGTLNLNNTVFGGEIIRWMEENAVHCGRVFTGNKRVYSIAMHTVLFNEPVYKSDWMQLKAHVVYVRNTTLEVDVELTAERGGKIVTTNRASFVLASLDEVGAPRGIPCGLQLEGVDERWRIKFACAKERYAASRSVALRDGFQHWNPSKTPSASP